MKCKGKTICEGATIKELERVVCDKDTNIPLEMVEEIVLQGEGADLFQRCSKHPGYFFIPDDKVTEAIAALKQGLSSIEPNPLDREQP